MSGRLRGNDPGAPGRTFAATLQEFGVLMAEVGPIRCRLGPVTGPSCSRDWRRRSRATDLPRDQLVVLIALQAELLQSEAS